MSRLQIIAKLLGPHELARLQREGTWYESIASRDQRAALELLNAFFVKAADAKMMGDEPPDIMQAIENLFTRNFLEASLLAFEAAEAGRELLSKPKRFAALPKPKIPGNLRDLMIAWDRVRYKERNVQRRKGVPLNARQRALAKRVKTEYLRRVQDFWVRHGEAWRSGETAVKQQALEALKKQTNATWARTKTIIETETTNNVNHARRVAYDQNPDVTHYLFLAVRDHATTKWCSSRHFTVFLKGTKLLEDNTPAVHWNCRSELVPLSPLNPAHKKIIENKAYWASNKQLAPLPPEWRNASAAKREAYKHK